jgi:hypothetical protein
LSPNSAGETQPHHAAPNTANKDGDSSSPAATVSAGGRSHIITGPVKVDRTKPVKIFGISMPSPISDITYNVGDAMGVFRYNAIKALPGFVVNNSSNTIGVVQLCAEMLMFKAGGFDLVDAKNKGKPLHYLIDPPKNVYGAVFKRAGFNGKFSDMFKWSTIKDSVIDFGNLEKAAKIDSHGGTTKLVNRWSARSGFSGIMAMTIATALPQDKETPQEVEQMSQMAQHNPVGYVAHRMGQAVWFPVDTVRRVAVKITHPSEDAGIGAGKRQFAGLGMMSAGICSFLSGFRQVSGKVVGNQTYMHNPWQMAGGLITLVAGSQLMLGVDNQQGWTSYGGTQLLRLFTLGPSITNRFKPDAMGRIEQGASWYLAAQAGLQGKNVVAVTIGGAEKLPDGTIVDHSGGHGGEAAAEPTKTAVEKAQPGTRIADARDHAMAMPQQQKLAMA